jgi:hypothetical protein
MEKQVPPQHGPASPWALTGTDFPVLDNRDEQLRYIAQYAALAPSTHNTQPWVFAVADGALDIFANRTRSLPVCDPHDRELTISCGAAVQFAWLAGRSYGFEVEVDLLPDRANADLLARISLGETRLACWAESRRFRAIPDRHTNRSAFKPLTPTKMRALERLADLAQAHDTLFRLVSDDTIIGTIAELVARGDRIQMADSSCRRELARWVRPQASGDGMSLASFGLRDAWSHPIAGLLRRLDAGRVTARKHEMLIRSSPWLGLLACAEDTPASWLKTGRALADILLELTANGLVASFANQPIEVPALRGELATAFAEPALPQMLIRIGIADPVAPASRRDIEELLVTS